MSSFYRITPGRAIFNIINTIIMIGVIGITLFPILHVFAASISETIYIQQGKVGIFPRGFSLQAYKNVMKYPMIGMAYLNTILYTSVGTVLSVVLTACAAYPLSRPRWYGQKFFLFLIIFPMLFNGGIVPTFLVVRTVGLYNSRWAIILPTAIYSFYTLIMRTFFQQIPYEIEESAIIDGASRIQCLFKMIFPLSKAGLVTIGLFYAVGLWNSYFPALIYLKDRAKYPIQLILREIVVLSNITEELSATRDMLAADAVAGEALKYAAIFVTILPIMAVYLWVQKYFVKGVLLGSIKG